MLKKMNWNSIFLFVSIFSFGFCQLSYNFTIPYAGAGTLTISNEGSSSVSISSLIFTTNAALNGNPWGNLYPYTATMTSAANGILTTYTITLNPPVVIGGSSSQYLTYSYSGAGGPLNLGMGPSYVAASISGGQVTPVLIGGSCQGDECNDPTPGKQSAGYYTSWGMYARKYDAIDIPVQYLNQLYYAFIGFSADGTLALLDSNSDGKQIPVIAMLKQQYPYLRASLSFGGWTLSGAFSAMANNSASRNNFVNNCVLALQETQFDGIDIDWEYPVVNGAPGEPSYDTPQDATNYPLLLAELRAGLNALAEKNKMLGIGATQYYLSITGAGGIDKIEAIQQYDGDAWSTIIASVDVMNVMTYDFHGAFDQNNGAPYDVSDFQSAMQTSNLDPYFNSPLLSTYDVISPVMAYMKLGFDASQIGIGIPAYGRLVNVATLGDTQGLWQTITGTPNGQYDNTGVFDYKCIQEGQCHGYTRLPIDMVFVQPTSTNLANDSHTPWGYSPSTLTFLTYDNADSAAYKACWAISNNFRGYMMWDLTGDFPPSDPNSLVGACHRVLTQGFCV